MKRVLTFAVAVLCSAPTTAFTQPAETEMPGVTAEVIELRQAGGVLRLAVRFTNSGSQLEDKNRFIADRIVLVDVKSKRKFLPLKDANGQFIAGPIGDWIGGGRIQLQRPPKQSTIVWAFFEPLPAGTAVSVELPTTFPFANVMVTDGPSQVFTATTTGHHAVWRDSHARVRDACESNAQRPSSTRSRYEPGQSYFEFINVFLFDPASKRKYPLLKDTEGRFQAQPNTVNLDGGRFIHAWGKITLVSLTFPAPPDTVQTVDLLLPRFLPLRGREDQGSGGAAAGGIAAAGKVLGLEGALKELNAEVTAAEIKVDFAADVLFDVDQSDLKSAAEERLSHLLTVVNSRPTSRIAIEGHTDLRGEAR